jgi:hypothetical protein
VSGTSYSGFLIFMCSAWKLPSIMKPRMKRFSLKQYVSGSDMPKKGWFRVVHTEHKIRPLNLASGLYFRRTRNQTASWKWALSKVDLLSEAPYICSKSWLDYYWRTWWFILLGLYLETHRLWVSWGS